MKCLIFVLFYVFLIFSYKTVNAAMSEAQLKATVRLIRNVCQPKTQATNEDIKKMHDGDWNVDHPAMCYMQCALMRNRLMAKNNTLNLEVGINLAKSRLPEARKNPSIEAMTKCKDSAKTLNDKCVAAYEISKCLYESNPTI
ncbi:general odorant-binding protein 72-like isoform X2 [Tenebrio molitor]|uniref:general odorant-binding protein 72-like isoform X2 n=1 Tax=Tenebrio molitor TaxID=7067 RepID=UPI003624781E